MIDHSINQVVPQILEALEGEVGGFAAARTAWAFSMAVDRIDADLEHCQALVENGDLVSAIVVAESVPFIRKRYQDLEFDLREDWDACSKQFNWKSAAVLRSEGGDCLGQALAEIPDLNAWVISQANLLDLNSSSDSRKAFALYSKLLRDGESDEALLKVYQNTNRAALANLTRDLEGANDVDECIGILDLYRSVGLDIPRKKGAIVQALESENEILLKRAEFTIDKLIGEFSDSLSDAEYLSKEPYFFDSYFSVHLKIGSLCQEKQTAFRAIENRFTLLREAFELNIQLSEALANPSKKVVKKQVRALLQYADQHNVAIEESVQAEIAKRKISKSGGTGPKKVLYAMVASGLAAALGLSFYFNASEPEDIQVVAESNVESDSVVYGPLQKELYDLVDRGFSVERDDAVKDVHERAIALANERGQELREAAPEIVYLINEFELLRQARARELQIIADYWIEQASDSVTNIDSIELESDLASAVEASQHVLGKAADALAAANEIDGDISEEVIYGPAGRLYEAQDRLDTLEYARANLLRSNSFNEFYTPLSSIQNHQLLTEDERFGVNETLNLDLDGTVLLADFFNTSEQASIPAILEVEALYDASADLNSEERYLLEELVSDLWIGNVYISDAYYFQGAETALNQFSIHSAEPFRTVEKSGEYARLIKWYTREFGRNGRPNSSESNYALVDKGAHGKYGYAFENSQLTAESVFFNDVLKVKIHGLLAGGENGLMLELIASLIESNDLESSLRAHWLSKLSEVLEKEPSKWRLDLAPEVLVVLGRVKELDFSSLNPNDWLASGSKKTLDIDFGNYVSIAERTKAKATFLKELSKGQLAPVGYVGSGDEINFNESVSESEPLWIIDGSSKFLVRIDQREVEALAFSPVIAYRNEGRSMAELLEKVRDAQGVELTLDDCRAIIPSLFGE